MVSLEEADGPPFGGVSLEETAGPPFGGVSSGGDIFCCFACFSVITGKVLPTGSDRDGSARLWTVVTSSQQR